MLLSRLTHGSNSPNHEKTKTREQHFVVIFLILGFVLMFYLSFFPPLLDTERRKHASCPLLTPCRSDTMWPVLEAALLRAGVSLVFHLLEFRTHVLGEVTEASTARGTSFAFKICTVSKMRNCGRAGGGSVLQLLSPRAIQCRGSGGKSRCRHLTSSVAYPSSVSTSACRWCGEPDAIGTSYQHQCLPTPDSIGQWPRIARKTEQALAPVST